MVEVESGVSRRTVVAGAAWAVPAVVVAAAAPAAAASAASCTPVFSVSAQNRCEASTNFYYFQLCVTTACLPSAETIEYTLVNSNGMQSGRGYISVTGGTVSCGIPGFSSVTGAPTTMTVLYRVDGGPQQSGTVTVPLITNPCTFA